MKNDGASKIFLLFLYGSVDHTDSAFQSLPRINRRSLDKSNNSHEFRLRMSHKDNERARFERELDNMMGNDWRLFRAQLVSEERQIQQTSSGDRYHRQDRYFRQERNHMPQQPHEVYARPNEFVSMNSDDATQRRRDRYDHTKYPKHDDTSRHAVSSINVGSDSLMFEVEGVECEDPFATPDEILAVREPKAMINKYRWAHPIPYIEPGCVLLASERVDGVLRQTVVLIVDHSDAIGSTGIIINR